MLISVMSAQSLWLHPYLIWDKLSGDEYYSANVGDSRIIIGHEGEKEVIFETEDHKPALEEEKKRIEASGGSELFLTRSVV